MTQLRNVGILYRNINEKLATLANFPNITPKRPHFPQMAKKIWCNPYRVSTQMTQLCILYTHINKKLAIVAKFSKFPILAAPFCSKMVQRDLRQPLSCMYFNDTARRPLYKHHLNSASEGHFQDQIGPKLTRKFSFSKQGLFGTGIQIHTSLTVIIQTS